MGDRAEDAFRQTMLVSSGELDVFWSNGLVGTIMGLAIFVLVWPLVSDLRSRARAKGIA